MGKTNIIVRAGHRQAHTENTSVRKHTPGMNVPLVFFRALKVWRAGLSRPAIKLSNSCRSRIPFLITEEHAWSNMQCEMAGLTVAATTTRGGNMPTGSRMKTKKDENLTLG